MRIKNTYILRAAALRLAGGADAQSGRVEFLYGPRWGTVCGDEFDDQDAQVICRQLGLEGGEARTGAYFGRGEGDIWLSRLDCLGGETDVMTCERDDAAAASCVHEEDAGVVCAPRESARRRCRRTLLLSGSV